MVGPPGGLKTASEPSQGIPPERWMPAVLDGRNAILAATVHASEHDRIVITYGAAHEPGWLGEMQKLDPNWSRATAG
jgi:hypothetical protein